MTPAAPPQPHTLADVDAELARRAGRPRTPARFAEVASGGRWKIARHLALLDDKLAALAEGRIKRLIVTMPPRHGKSELCSKYFPAWFLGTHPDNRIILASYEAELAASWGQKARDLIEEHGPSLFGVAVRPDARARNDWRIDGRDGQMMTAGVGGAITGKGATILVVDDPIKNAADAGSKTYRDKTWDWWYSTAFTRLEPDGRAMVIHTRWHEDDLIGRLIAQDAASDAAGEEVSPDERWEVLNLPAIAEEENDALGRRVGDALWPEAWPADKLQKRKKKFTAYVWAALYQQRPSPGDGGTFKRDWFPLYTVEDGCYRLHRDGKTWLVHPRDCQRFATMDVASSEKASADKTALHVWDLTPSWDMVLVARWSERAEIPEVISEAARVYRDYDVAWLGVEKAHAGIAVFQTLRNKGLTVRALLPKGDKLQRAQHAVIKAEQRQIHLPKAAVWTDGLLQQLATFPQGHDDDVDALAYAALAVHRMCGSPTTDADRHAAAAEAARVADADEAGRHPGSTIDAAAVTAEGAGDDDPAARFAREWVSQ